MIESPNYNFNLGTIFTIADSASHREMWYRLLWMCYPAMYSGLILKYLPHEWTGWTSQFNHVFYFVSFRISLIVHSVIPVKTNHLKNIMLTLLLFYDLCWFDTFFKVFNVKFPNAALKPRWGDHTVALCIHGRFVFSRVSLFEKRQDIVCQTVTTGCLLWISISSLCLHSGNWDAYEFCLRSYQKPRVMTIPSQMNWHIPRWHSPPLRSPYISSSHSDILPHNNEDKIVNVFP